MKKLQWFTEKRKANSLKYYDKNPRIMPEKSMEDLKNSLKKVGLAEIPAVDLDGTIVAGNQRVRALQALGRGEEEIDVRLPNRKLTEAEFKFYLLASNRITGLWDFDALKADFDIETLLATGFDSNDLSRIFDDNLTIENDNFDEETELKKIKKTDIKPGNYFALGRHRLFCSNALDPATAKKLMAGVKADMVNDDLPYNIGLSYDKGIGNKSHYGGTTDDNKTDEEYRIFVKTIMQNALSVTKPDAHVFFWCDERYVWLFQELYKELGLDSKRLCIWIKDNASPTPQIAFNKVTEYCIYGTKGRPFLSDKVKNLNELLNKELTSGNRLSDDILDLLNIWLVKRLPGNEYMHPTQKNPQVHEKALRRCTRPGDVVLDLTCGSGSILSACHQLKRTAYVCDYEPIFCQLTINRFKQISNDKIKKLN
jgi:site-specific DNA-methyltransferase (adenine-specific)